MEIMKKTNGRNLERMQQVGGLATLIHCWWEYKLVQPLWKSVWRFLKNLKISQVWWFMSIIPVIWEAEKGSSWAVANQGRKS
jgi:hypothetical protein